MKYNFGEVAERQGIDSVEYDVVPERWGRNDLLPMWMTGMDFRIPPSAIEVIRRRLDHEVLGYTLACGAWYTSIVSWQKERRGWNITREMLTFTPGVVCGLALALQYFTAPDDRVMVMPPVRHPFLLVTEHNHRGVVYNPLALEDEQYQIDSRRFRTGVKERRILILSNPHNPGGRVWVREELAEIAEIYYENQVLVIPDEIHADLTLPEYTYPAFALVSEKAHRDLLVFTSSSKAFNMPGPTSSYCIIENEDIRRRFQAYTEASEFSKEHLFAYLGVAAAYSNGTEWLDQMLEYIQGNIDFTDGYLRANIPVIRAIRPQASYLIFLDCHELGLSQEELVSFFVDGVHLALNDGAMSGKEGEGFMCFNVAHPRSVSEQALDQIKQAYRKKYNTIV